MALTKLRMSALRSIVDISTRSWIEKHVMSAPLSPQGLKRAASQRGGTARMYA